MKRLANLIGLAALTYGCTGDATLRIDPEDFPLPSPPITDCATDHRVRGRPSEQPVESGVDLKAVLDADLKGGIADLRAHEPLCFYLVPDGLLLLRDGRGLEYYFHKVPKWDYYKIDLPAREPSR